MKKPNEFETILWDWNGTLLNDTSLCVEIMNNMLSRRNIPTLDLEKYREIFTFPVREYYNKAGFDFGQEAFEIPATEFIEVYNSRMKEAPLFDDVLGILDHFKNKNKKQFIISAMKKDKLIELVNSKGLALWFNAIAGINDHYAHGKEEAALKLMAGFGLHPKNVCLVGDTRHDYEVAVEIGCSCILVAQGHQSYQRLKGLACKVVHELKQVIDLIE